MRSPKEAQVNIFFRELRANLKSLVIWCVILILLVVVGAAKFTAYYNNPSMLAVLNAFPKAFIDAMELKTFNLTTVTGFYGLMMIYYALMGGIAAAMWASDSISKEERDKTVEFSLVLPVSRGRVITGKLLAALVNSIVFVLVTWGVSWAAAQQFHPDQTFNRFLALEMAAMFFIELIFLAVGLLLGCAMKQYKNSGSIAIAIILVTYFLSVMSGMQANLDFLKYFTPFKYFDAGALIQTGKLDPTYLLLSAAIIVVCVVAAYWTYNRRDLYI
jgi:ABC-2 type transport system permease protein